jgi:tRNA (mo5U34)-methyltransferase
MPMTKEEMEREVARLGPWFHSIDLGQGVRTKTKSVGREPADHPRSTWELVKECLPQDLTGKGLLDVGCNAGFYSVEAKRRNAERVLGVDAQRREVRQARFVKKALGLDGLEFRRLSVYDLSLETVGLFDVTLALGLIYHLKHLVLALERLFEVTKELLVLETAMLPREAELTVPRGFETTYEEILRPVAYLENPGDRKEAVFNWFLPSVEATVAMLKAVGFDEVSLFRQKGDRGVFVARRERRAPDSRTPGWIASQLALVEGPLEAARGEALAYRVRAENRGLATWLAKGDPGTGTGAVHLGAHLLDADGDEVEWDYGMAPLPRDLARGEGGEVELRLYAPDAPGLYCVELDLVAENVAWFDDLGSRVLSQPLKVREDTASVPWFRVEGALEGLRAAGRATAAGDYLALRDALEEALAGLPPERRVATAFEWILGQTPDDAALRFHAEGMSRRADPNGWLLRRLLLKEDAAEVPPVAPPEAARARLFERNGLAPSHAVARQGESFSGEHELGKRLLAEGAALDAKAFVELGFARILGRSVDDGGRDWYAGRLTGKSMNRAHLLRDLFWSAELRASAGEAPPEVTTSAEMARAWDERAGEDALFYIASGASASAEEFRRSGVRELDEYVLDGVDLARSASVLEIGCGIGRLLAPLSARVAEAHGVDVSPAMVARAREFCADRPNVSLAATDGTLAGVADDSVDFVFSFLVFQHVPDAETIERYLRESKRVLAPGGLVRFQVDGRWRLLGTPDTYDGVKLRGPEVRRMVADAGLELLREWGEETHYYIVDAQKPGVDPRVLLAPRVLDTSALAGLLPHEDAETVAERTAEVARGERSLRSALGAELARLPDEPVAFVRAAFALLLGREPRPEEETFHVRSLDVTDRDSVLDALLASGEFARRVTKSS